ncbi:hypothetical protein KI387_038648, partial [Taxus chinensis]
GMVVVTLVAIGGSVCGIERMRLWNGVGVTDTTDGCVTMGIFEMMGVDWAMAWVVNEGITNTTSTSDIANVTVMA